MKIRKSTKIIIWIFAMLLSVAALWSYFTDANFPLPGLVKFAGQQKIYSIAEASVIVGMAIFLSVGRWQTRDNLLVLKGVALCLWVIGMLYVSIPFGLAAWVVSMSCNELIKISNKSLKGTRQSGVPFGPTLSQESKSMHTNERLAATERLLILQWISLALPFSLAGFLALPWALKATGLSGPQVLEVHSFSQRLFTSPISYLPILLALVPVLGVAIWPSRSRPYRSLFAAGILVGLGMTTMWGFDGGLGNYICAAGLGLLCFAAAESIRFKLQSNF